MSEVVSDAFVDTHRIEFASDNDIAGTGMRPMSTPLRTETASSSSMITHHLKRASWNSGTDMAKAKLRYHELRFPSSN